MLDMMETADRRSIAREIGRYFDEQGVDVVILLEEGSGDMSRELAHWKKGTLMKLTPKRKSAPGPATEPLD